jgi:hypothetical protein
MFLIPGSVIAAVTFPGVVIHELAHQLVCRYLKIPVFKVCYFQFGNPAGYVIHGQTDNWVHQVLVSVGPFFINSILGAILSFPSALRAFEFDNAASILDLVLIWLGVSIAMHAIPSTGDAKSIWRAVSGQQTSLLAKIVIAPIVGVIFLLALGSVFWLDLIYGIAVSLAIPTLLVKILA